MGLDSIVYEMRGVSNKELAKALEPLCGGSFMTEDSNSFRGKVYSDLNEAICSLSLYDTDEWTSATFTAVVHDYEQLIEEGVNEWLAEFNKTDNRWSIEYKEEEVLALYNVFKLCLENNWQISAWY